VKEAAAGRAGQLTRQLLLFGRRDVITPVVFDPGETIEELQPLIKRSIRENIELIIDLAQARKPQKLDRGQFEQVLLNLAVNARDAMPGGGRLTIRTKVVRIGTEEAAYVVHPVDGDYVHISVSDTGTGMSPVPASLALTAPSSHPANRNSARVRCHMGSAQPRRRTNTWSMSSAPLLS